MKKIFAMLIILTLFTFSLLGCASGSSKTASPESTGNTIVLGDTISIDGSGATGSDQGVKITAAGTYNISGTLSDGMIEVDAPDAAVTLVLDGASITNSQGPAILFSDGTEAMVTLKANTSNLLADGGSSEYDAALYSKPSLTINGEGSLTVAGNANEGISSEMHITFAGGSIQVKALEDGINANNDGVSVITVSGGYLYVESATGDGIDSNGTIEISGGTVIALSSLTDASGGLDADGDVTITGGTVIATGAQLSTPVAASTQKSILASYTTTQAANTLATIQQDGQTILAFAPALAYQLLLYSAKEIADDLTYDIYSGGTASGEAVNGLYQNTVAEIGEKVSSITTASITEAKNRGPQGAPKGDFPGEPPEGMPDDKPEDIPAQ